MTATVPSARPDRLMHAAVFDRPAPDASATRVAQFPTPEPGPGQVAIDVRHAGINFKDIMARRGDPGYVDAWPFVPGLEAAGTVRALGDGVTGLRMGDPVVAFVGAGGLAEVVIADARLTIPVPAAVGLEQAAAATGALVTAALLVEDIGRLAPGETVLIHGAGGGVGQAVAQFARLSGSGLVLGSVGSPARADAALRFGYDAVLPRDDRFAAAISAATGGRGIDLILDPQGTALIELDLQMIASGGRVILFGNASGGALEPLPPLHRLLARNAGVAGFSLAALAVDDPARVAVALARVLELLAAGAMRLELTRIDGLTGVAAAHEALAAGTSHAKPVVDLTRG